MTVLFRQIIVAVSIGMVLFCASCEKHRLGEMPEVQREQSDPAKRVWPEGSEMKSEKSASSPTPAEFFPHQPR
ncbi:MAG: hypothetical protein DME20_11545 [Verrucomicrobia bacterium]|nr:MAG: hypothetical protein AUH91_03320 [Verrucomicrobia bacterium 13_1_40CM_4_54_4]PYJ78904.1 MAG: hypothetical protein DME69_06805 [Verrucomicrobiota bacterium]PYK47563.1 MAG: hypothetical protein DME20_11545 [Verrucomicrobiota bacterium]